MKPLIRIGVLAHRDSQHTLNSWQPTAAYLTAELGDSRFEIVPLDFAQIGMAVAQQQVEFVILSSGIYVELEALYGVNRLATLKKRRLGQPHTFVPPLSRAQFFKFRFPLGSKIRIWLQVKLEQPL